MRMHLHIEEGDHADVRVEREYIAVVIKGLSGETVLMLPPGGENRARLIATVINGDLVPPASMMEALRELIRDACPCNWSDDTASAQAWLKAERLCGEPLPDEDYNARARSAITGETPDPCTEEAFARGCFCYVPAPGPTDIDPPEPKRHPECPLHGWRDPDAEFEAKRDDEMMARIKGGAL